MFIVWHDFGSEGWMPSSELVTLDDVWGYLLNNPYRDRRFVVTEKIDVKLVRS